MRIVVRKLRLHLWHGLLAVMLCGTCHAAQIADAKLDQMRAVAAQCIAQHMTPDQICQQLRKQFGDRYIFGGRSVMGDQGTDIQVQVGIGAQVTFLETLGRVTYCRASHPC